MFHAGQIGLHQFACRCGTTAVQRAVDQITCRQFALPFGILVDAGDRQLGHTQGAINEIKSQRRNEYYALNDLYKNYYESGAFNVDPSKHLYNNTIAAPNVTDRSFTIPLPSADISYNPLLMEAPEDYDLSGISF